MYTLGQSHFVPFMVTILGIVFTDLLMGIGIGLAVAIFYILYNNYKKPFIFESDKHLSDGTIHIELAEDVTFINKAGIQRALNQIPDGSKVIIDCSKSINIDQDVIEIINEFQTNALFRDVDVQLIERKKKGVKNQIKEIENAISNNLIPVNGKVKSAS